MWAFTLPEMNTVTCICQVLEAVHNVSQQRLMRVEQLDAGRVKAFLMEYRVIWLSVSSLKVLQASCSSFIVSWSHACMQQACSHNCVGGILAPDRCDQCVGIEP